MRLNGNELQNNTCHLHMPFKDSDNVITEYGDITNQNVISEMKIETKNASRFQLLRHICSRHKDSSITIYCATTHILHKRNRGGRKYIH